MSTQGELFEGAGGGATVSRGGALSGSRTGRGEAGGSDPDLHPRQDLNDRQMPEPEGAPAPVWLQRMSLVILVLFCFYIGALLTVLPWSPRFWDGNGWLRAHPEVAKLHHPELVGV